jgi:diguanylate cyclase (GGDEF)-like protein
MNKVVEMTGDHGHRMSVQHLGDRVQALLAFYLKTEAGLDATDPSPTFCIPRSALVDDLLCSLMLDGVYVVDELYEALNRVHDNPIVAYESPGELTSGWARRVAGKIHPVTGLQERLQAYLQTILEEQAEREEPEELERALELELGELEDLREQGQRDEDVPIIISVPEPDSIEGEEIERTEEAITGTLDQLLDQIASLKSQVEELQARSRSTLPGSHNRRYFEQRLAEEVSRASRLNEPLSVILFEIIELEQVFCSLGSEATSTILRQLGKSVRRSLREYDILSRNEAAEFMVILPGATPQDCSTVVARLRSQFSANAEAEVCMGTASWPQDAGNVVELIDEAKSAMERDRQRLLAGEVEIGSIPASMVEGTSERTEQHTTVWFEGFPQEVRVRAVQTPQGLRIKLPLRFLRSGSSIHLDLPEGTLSGTLRETVLGISKPVDNVPMLYLDVATDPSSKAN